jgi:O-antigen ligase
MHQKGDSKLLYNLILWLYVILFISIVFSLRAITSISIGLILILGIIKTNRDCNLIVSKAVISPLFWACVLLYLLKCFSLFYTEAIGKGIKHLGTTSGLIIVPLAVYSSNTFLNKNSYGRLMAYFTAILFSSCLYCLVVAFTKYKLNADQTVFFYHDLVKPISQHAIQFSVFIFINLVYLFGLLKNGIKRPLIYSLIIYFSIFLVLLSSKLVLSFYLLYVLYYLIKVEKRKIKPYVKILFIAVPLFFAGLILITTNPVSNRFRDITSMDMTFTEQKKFSQAAYFNGLQFRLLQWRFVYEILNDNHGWVLGLTPGDSQSYLNKKYISSDMYVGKTGTKDHGFLGYNTHNQFLQSLLQTGILGLTAFLFICFAFVRIIIKQKNMELSFIVLLLLALNFTDTLLETQYGLLTFIFFPLFILFSKNLNSKSYTSPLIKK